MTTWRVIFQEGDLPISVSRTDGVTDGPPSGLVRYFEIAFGSWTMAPVTKSIAHALVEYPRLCPEVRCPGSFVYVEHLSVTALNEEGRSFHPHGWQCDVCGSEMDDGFGFREREWPR
jgi:hypothetical protein